MGRSNVVIKFTKPGAPTLADICTVFINIGMGKFMFLSSELVIRYKKELFKMLEEERNIKIRLSYDKQHHCCLYAGSTGY